jgi:predicted RNase H-like nuclease
MDTAGVDGCRAGWLCVHNRDSNIEGEVFTTFQRLLHSLPRSTLIAVDIPIGLPTSGDRACDRMARRFLGAPRASSVFPTPVLAIARETDYQTACAKHREIDGRALSRQAFAILPKILEVNELLSSKTGIRDRVKEIHPEVSFATWNSGLAMRYRKSDRKGAAEREMLIDREWPGRRLDMVKRLGRAGYQRDDLNDAFAALWTAGRVIRGIANVLGSPLLDGNGLCKCGRSRRECPPRG